MLLGLLTIAGFGHFMPVGASHVLGGEIGYSHLGGKKYRFKVHVYRNCNDCEFNTGGCTDIRELDIYESPDVNPSPALLGTVNLTRISRKDITPVCAGTKSSCAGGSFPQGIEDWYYEGDFDFTVLNNSYCKFEISLKLDNRRDVWTPGVFESYYNFTRLNICNSISNNSPAFQSPAAYLLPLNQTFNHQLLAADPDGDSLVYELVTAQKGFNRDVTYGSGYSGTYPLDVYCPSGNCGLKPKTWPVEGIGIDAETGWLAFTPVKNLQTGFLVIQCTELRRISGTWTVVGVSRRDMQVLVTDQLNYTPRVRTTADTFYACAGEEFALDISVSDQIYGTRDSVKLQAFSSELNGKIGIAGGNGANNYDALWLFTPTGAQIRSKPYQLTIVGKDDHCPVYATTYTNVKIIVAARPDAAFLLRHTKCNSIAFQTVTSKGGEEHNWFIADMTGMIGTVNGKGGMFDVPTPGKYYVTHQVKNQLSGCMTEIRDSVEVPWFNLMTPAFNWPAEVCKGDTLTLRAVFDGGTSPFSLFWNGQPGGMSREFIFNDSQRIRLNIVDKTGCTLDYQALITLRKPAIVAVTDTVQCMPPAGEKISLDTRYRIQPWPGKMTEMIKIQGDGLLNKVGNSYFYQPYNPGSSTYKLFHRDDNGCRYSDTFTVTLVKPPPTGISDFGPLCTNQEAVNVQQASRCALPGGTWNMLNAGGGFDGLMFSPAKVSAGRYQFRYRVNYSGCVILDTAAVTVHTAPVIQFTPGSVVTVCENSPAVTFLATPSGGAWFSTDPAIKVNVLSPAVIASSGRSSGRLHYAYQDLLTGCKAEDSAVVNVSRRPVLAGLRDTSVCGHEKILLKLNPLHATRIQIDGISGPVVLSRWQDDVIAEGEDVLTPQTATVTYKLTALPGCADEVYKQIIRVKPRPFADLIASPADACVPFRTSLKLQQQGLRPLPDVAYWSTDPGVPGSLTNILDVDQPGSRLITVHYQLDGCSGSDLQIQVTGHETPTASFSIDPKIRITTADFPFFLYRNTSVSRDSLKLNWQFAGGKPSTGFLPRHDVAYPQDTGKYKVTLRVTTKHGCTDLAEQFVYVAPKFRLWVPNVFTPDNKGPGQNERWGVYIDSMLGYELILRNKWGEIVFRTTDPHATWDGMYLGSPAPNGMYAWHIKGNNLYGRYIDESGTFMLVR